MASLGEVIQAQATALEAKADLDLNYKQVLEANPPEPDAPSVDLQIHEAIEELRRLKADHIQMRTQELFMKSILTAQSLNDLPTSQEAGRAEVALQNAKRDLRKIKSQRNQHEEQLASVAADLGTAVRDHEQAQHEAHSSLRHARVQSKSAEVEDMLNRRDMAKIELLAADIDELDASCCRKVIATLREERRLLERKANQQSASLENLRKEVEGLEQDVNLLTTETNQLKSSIETENQRNPSVAKLRHEFMLQKELENTLAALTGVRVAEVREHGISFDLNTSLFVPFVPGVDRSNPTHRLDVQFRDDSGDHSQIDVMALHPTDVEVSDIYNDRGISLCVAVQKVCTKLAKFTADKNRY